MEQINQPQQQKQQKQELSLEVNSVQYKAILELIDLKLKITLITEAFSPFKWSKEFTQEQLQKLSTIFLVCNSIEMSCENLARFLKNNELAIRFIDQAMILNINLNSVFSGCSFDLFLPQTEINSSEAFIQVNKQMLTLEQKINELSTKIEERDEEINQLRQLVLQQGTNKQTVSQTYPMPDEKDRSKILLEADYSKIENWINNGLKKINFQIIYRATVDGFKMSQLYQKCTGKTHVLVLIKSTENKRFGFCIDKEIKVTNAWIAQNPNNIFLFSLYESKRYNSNEKNQNQAYCFHPNYIFIGTGTGNDLKLADDSNQNENSSNTAINYGKNEGIKSANELSGQNNFKTVEIEVIQLISS